MSYTPNVWQAGDVVTPVKLNHIEEGIANSGGSFVVHSASTAGVSTLDKTWQEIYNALAAGMYCVLVAENEPDVVSQTPLLQATHVTDNLYRIIVYNSDDYFDATSASGYPSLTAPK